MSTPLYRRIAAELRHAISRGELPPGSQLPTEQELGDRYKVSRNTVRLALGLLTNEGIITSTPGRGTFVRDRIMLTYHAARAEAADRPDDWHTDAYFTEVRQQGRQPSQTFDMRIDPASLGVAQRLRVEEGEAVVVRRMIRYVDGEPWSIQDSSYPMDIAQEAGLLVPHDLPGGTVPGDGRARPRRGRLPRRTHHPHAHPRRGPDPGPRGRRAGARLRAHLLHQGPARPPHRDHLRRGPQPPGLRAGRPGGPLRADQ